MTNSEQRALASPPEIALSWSPPRWVLTITRGITGLLMIAAAIATLVFGAKAISAWNREFEFLTLALFPIILFITVAIHEYGHVLGARWGRLTPMRMRVGRLDLLKQRRGWRVRLHRNRQPMYGFVIAYPQPGTPLRAAYIKMTVAGPSANLVAAAIFCGCGLAAGAGASEICLALAVMNLAIGVINLIPTAVKHPSDGLLLLGWWRGIPENEPGLVFTRLMGLSLEGMTADEYPEATMALLAQQPLPMRLTYEYLRLKASQDRGEWWVAEDVERELQNHLGALGPAMAHACEDLIALLRAEIVFSKMLVRGDSNELENSASRSIVEWFAPYLIPRIQALRAALAGNVQERDRQLRVSEIRVEQSLDRGLQISETRLRKAVLGVQAAVRA